MAISNSSLSPERQQLIREMQRINFGRIEALVIRDRQPIDVLALRRQREVKFGSENGPRPELNAADFQLKQQVVELFDYFDQLQNGVIDVLEIRHGLPFRMIVTEAAA